MKKRKILYISGTRADYGLMKETLFCLNRKMRVEVVATGMHLMKEFGLTINDIKKDGFRIHRINSVCKRDDRSSMTDFIGKFITLLNKEIGKINPDMILLLGDRGEMLGGAIVGAYSGILNVHIHGGEKTSTVDELARHAITKLSHIHLCATRNAANRVIKMGEHPKRVYVVGAPGLDAILQDKLYSTNDISRIYKLDINRPFLLVAQHPVTEQLDDAANQMKHTMDAIKELGYQTIVIYPSADAGGRKMIEVIEKYRKYPFISIHRSILHKNYLSLLRVTSALIGNSSSGIIEAPSFKTPVINIGIRQEGREKASNVIDTQHDKKQILGAIKKALNDRTFRKKLKTCKSPYGDGRTGQRITEILSKLKVEGEILQKKLSY